MRNKWMDSVKCHYAYGLAHYIFISQF